MTTLPAHDHSHAHAADDGHGHAHPKHLGHHWANSKQQFEAGKLGMWLFLATEVLLFGGLFCAYSVWRGNHPELFQYGSKFLNTQLGAINTAVLILSSLTMAWGVTCAQKNQQWGLRLCLVLTLMGAATFMVIKYFEYTHKFHEGYFPGIKFYDKPPEHSEFWTELAQEKTEGAAHDTSGAVGETKPDFEITTVSVTPATTSAAAAQGGVPTVEASTIAPAQVGPGGMKADAVLTEQPFKLEQRHSGSHVHPLLDPNRPANVQMFFNIYFMMTGLHGIHVLIGMIVITWLLIKSLRGQFSAEYFTPVDLGGLYWHIVDLIWIFLFPLFYLI